MNPQSSMAKPIGRRQALDQLGDLFFGAAGGRQSPSPAGPSLDDLLARPLETPNPEAAQATPPAVPVTAFLTAGLPPERRLVLAREAISKLSASHGRTALVTFDGDRATVAALGRSGEDSAATPRVDHFSDVIRAADRLTLVLVDGAASFLESGRCLPDHCVVLTLSDPESLVEAYRELKAATAATSGPVPDLFVLEADCHDQAERTYRRLARVAIAHLGCTPTFAGHLVGKGHTASLGPTECVFNQLDAEIVYRTLRPMLKAHAAATAKPARAEPERPQPVVRPAEPQPGRRQTLPPVAGVVDLDGRQATRGGTFAVWTPVSRDDILHAAATSLEGLLPGHRGLIDVRTELASEAECPDLVAVDRDGGPIAILLADGGDPSVLLRAGRCRTWLATYGRLLARAYPEAGLAAEGRPATCMVLVAEEATATLRGLCPQDVRLITYLPLTCGSAHGLLLREASDAVSTVIGTVCERKPASAAVALTAVPPVTERPIPERVDLQPDWPATAAATEPDAANDSSTARGTSPDDDLSADELSDLRTGFEIDELT
ncbi:MAG: hypothetical protein JXL80_16310 [Planctomycetes bacterium]|nr:hypothetical protein [Planctomycetota bacterium]